MKAIVGRLAADDLRDLRSLRALEQEREREVLRNIRWRRRQSQIAVLLVVVVVVAAAFGMVQLSLITASALALQRLAAGDP